MKNEDILKNILTIVCDNFVDTLLVGIEEYEKDFPYTIAVANFIAELRNHNIVVDFYGTFDSKIIDMVNRETSNYLAR